MADIARRAAGNSGLIERLIKDAQPALNAEVRIRDSRSGKPMWVLPSGKKDNHALDCEIMAMLVAVRWGIVGRSGAGEEAPLDA